MADTAFRTLLSSLRQNASCRLTLQRLAGVCVSALFPHTKLCAYVGCCMADAAPFNPDILGCPGGVRTIDSDIDVTAQGQENQNDDVRQAVDRHDWRSGNMSKIDAMTIQMPSRALTRNTVSFA